MFVLVCFFCLNEKSHLVLISFLFFYNITKASMRNKSLRLATVGILKTSFHFYLGCRVRKSSLTTEWSVFFLCFSSYCNNALCYSQEHLYVWV